MLQQNFSLKKYNTFGIEVQAKYFSEFNSADDLAELLQSTANDQQSTLILGGGSNILLTKNFEGLVLKNNIKGINIIKEHSEYVFLSSNGCYDKNK